MVRVTLTVDLDDKVYGATECLRDSGVTGVREMLEEDIISLWNDPNAVIVIEEI